MRQFSLTTLMYHYVRTPGDSAEAGSGIAGLSPARFEAQLDWLARRHTPIGWPTLLAALRGAAELPPDACLLTFDDGVADHYATVFPRLRERGMAGLFFVLARRPDDGLVLAHKIHYLLARLGVDTLRQAVIARLEPRHKQQYRRAEQRYAPQLRGTADDSAVELLKLVLQRELEQPAAPLLDQLLAEADIDQARAAATLYVSDQQLAEMLAGGMHIGGHSRTHPWFDRIGARQQGAEIAESATWLDAITPGPHAFAYPYGGYNGQSARLLRRHGFAAAFTTRPHTQQSDPFRLGRFDGELLPACPDERRVAQPEGTA